RPAAARPRAPRARAPAGPRPRATAPRPRLHWDLRGAPLAYDFRFGRPAFADFPHALWCPLLGRRARSAHRSDLDYGAPEGRIELREALAERLRRVCPTLTPPPPLRPRARPPPTPP